jgi:hypothetical protein
VKKQYANQLVGHLSRDSMAIEAREKPIMNPSSEEPKAINNKQPSPHGTFCFRGNNSEPVRVGEGGAEDFAQPSSEEPKTADNERPSSQDMTHDAHCSPREDSKSINVAENSSEGILQLNQHN